MYLHKSRTRKILLSVLLLVLPTKPKLQSADDTFDLNEPPISDPLWRKRRTRTVRLSGNGTQLSIHGHDIYPITIYKQWLCENKRIGNSFASRCAISVESRLNLQSHDDIPFIITKAIMHNLHCSFMLTWSNRHNCQRR